VTSAVAGAAELVFPLVFRRRISGVPFGDVPSLRRGRGTDLAGTRPYVAGDPVATIDWRTSARLSAARGEDAFVVRERFADEAPNVVVLRDRRSSMALYPPELPWLAKPVAARLATEAIVASAAAARAPVGYLDLADGEPTWIAPRARGRREAIAEREERAADTAPESSLADALGFLDRHAAGLPAGSIVFVVSDFLAPLPEDAWLGALARRWDVVPVVLQDPVWEQSFPDVHGVVVPVVPAGSDRVRDLRLRRGEVAARRRANERARAELLRLFADLDLDAVLVDSHERGAIVGAFLDWADRRGVGARR
jgi:uncharacterized protein (DUF58 family)